MKTFSLINKKGGVGKTTITVNLAYALAESCDLRVLVIDNDDQGNDTQFFGIEEGRTLADILLQKAGLSEVIQHTRYPKIDIVPSSEALLDANVVIIKCCCSPFLSLPCPRHLPKTAPMFCRITA